MRNRWSGLAVILALGIAVLDPARAEPPPGHPDPGRARDILGLPSGTPRIHSGRVREAIDSNAYVYVRVATDQGERWLAAPRMTVPVDALVRWGDGADMRDFYSKKLRRGFDSVLFVDGLDVLAGP